MRKQADYNVAAPGWRVTGQMPRTKVVASAR
jgi:hypothetical protein